MTQEEVIKSWKSGLTTIQIDEEDMTITCTELKKGEICYGKLNLIKQIKELTIEEAQKELSEKYDCEDRKSVV